MNLNSFIDAYEEFTLRYLTNLPCSVGVDSFSSDHSSSRSVPGGFGAAEQDPSPGPFLLYALPPSPLKSHL